MPLECSICYEEFIPSKKLRINCVQCKNYICSDCFLEIVVVCLGLCHINYVCPVCKQKIYVSRGFLELLINRLPDKELVELKDENRDVIIKIIKDLKTGHVSWKKRNDQVWFPFVQYIIPSRRFEH